MPSEIVDFPIRSAERDPPSPLLQHFERSELDTRQVVLTAGCAALALAVLRMASETVTLSLTAHKTPSFRPGIGVGLLDRGGRILVMRRGNDACTAWRLPQGQLGADESPVEGAQRVLRESCGVGDLDPISQSFGWLRYEFPAAAVERLFANRWRGQQQKWIAARFTARDEILDQAAAGAGVRAWRWARLDELAGLIRPLQPLSLEALVRLFG